MRTLGSPTRIRSGIQSGPAGTLAVLAGTQFVAGIGFYAVTAHLVMHLRHGLGLLAVGASVVIGIRTIVQYGLYLPAGVLADRLGPARTAALACALRAAGFAALATATRFPALVGAMILIGVGGCVYTPAGYSILAGLPDRWARRGFAWYTAAGQLSAVAGPVVGLVLVAGPDGFAGLAWLAAVAWAVAAMLMASLGSAARGRGAVPTTPVRSAVRAVRHDRALLRFALAVSPATLLITQAAVVVPLAVFDIRLTTLFLSGGAICAAAAQFPFWRATLIRHGLSLGFGSFATAYALLIPATVLPADASRTTLVGLAGALYGLAQGALLPALFHQTRRLAPPGLSGVYFGAVNFVTGVAALAGGTATGLLFDHGSVGTVMALTGLGTSAALAIKTSPSRPRRQEHDPPARHRRSLPWPRSGSDLSGAPGGCPDPERSPDNVSVAQSGAAR
ncbi:MFS transporter [Plantactinospora solaniradicis]|uniref:MFS transporter n=1 Tax=Plantactinospora solaniradicis TaxID=1723736 RepID=A0ABW1KH63_9ACTN